MIVQLTKYIIYQDYILRTGVRLSLYQYTCAVREPRVRNCLLHSPGLVYVSAMVDKPAWSMHKDVRDSDNAREIKLTYWEKEIRLK
jgi:hypothetical protein